MQPKAATRADGVFNMVAAPRHILNVELSTLRQRQGELKTEADGAVGVWRVTLPMTADCLMINRSLSKTR
ncbi:putative autotransporter protein [Yersinia frederiksenii]|nr:putative autotransporter protein [Yersinia frederiksenii]